MSRLITAAMPLTQRQHQILTLAIEGLTEAEIGQRLKVTKYTVKHHSRSLRGRLGGEGRNDWAVIGISRGWLPLPSHLATQVRTYRDLPATDPGKDIVELLALGYRLPEISQMRGLKIELIWSRMRVFYRRLGIGRAETAVAIAVWARQGKTPLAPMADPELPKSEVPVRGNPTARQLAVLAQTALGYKYNQICQQLGLAYGTVVSYCVSARYRLNAQGRSDGIIKAIQAGLLPCPVTELGAVARFVQLRLTPVETELVDWALNDEPTAPSARLLQCSHRLAKKIQPEHRPYAIDYIVAIVLWAERGLGWSDEDRAMAVEWLSDQAEPGLDLPAIHARLSQAQTRVAVLGALAEGYDVPRLAKQYGWEAEQAKDYLKTEIGRGGQVSLAQAVSASIRDSEISPPAQLEPRLQAIRNQVTLNGSEKKMIMLLASARDPIAACERAGIAPRFLSLHMSRLQAKLGVHTPAGLVGMALWAGLLDDKSANANSVGML
jgi:DNA-binding CsgD family transcriptional regulator